MELEKVICVWVAFSELNSSRSLISVKLHFIAYDHMSTDGSIRLVPFVPTPS